VKFLVPQLLLFGYFGAGNFGDEWTLASFLKSCQQFGFNRNDFVAVSRAPHRTTNEHDIPAIPRDWRTILSSMRKCQAVVGCGGSLLQDVTSFRSLVFYCLLIWLAKGMGKKVVLLGQGLGPLNRPISRKLAKHALNACDLVTFRERVSFEVARKLGVREEICFVTADLTFVWDDLPNRELKAEFGVNLRPVKERWRVDTFARAMENALEEENRILLLPLQPNSDEFALRPLAKLPRANWWRYETWLDGLKGIASVGLLVAMRLHALIAACLLGIPFVGLNYDPKVANILSGVIGGRILPLSAEEFEFADAIKQTIDDHATFSDKLREFAATQKAEAQRNFELLASKLLG
jgi:polysaccharide pyruvyl transferase CsaB